MRAANPCPAAFPAISKRPSGLGTIEAHCTDGPTGALTVATPDAPNVASMAPTAVNAMIRQPLEFDAVTR
jgi:hypothetical protein